MMPLAENAGNIGAVLNGISALPSILICPLVWFLAKLSRDVEYTRLTLKRLDGEIVSLRAALHRRH